MIDYSRLAYCVEPMRVDDLDAVMVIEKDVFSAPWTARAYDYELRYNELAHYFVVRAREELASSLPTPVSWWQRFWRQAPQATTNHFPVLGYGGLWLQVDEAHISTIATHWDWRGRGIGELLLVAMIDAAAGLGAHVVTLEVRVSNLVAQALYRKYRFDIVGERKRYYSDNGEDAYIMTTPSVKDVAYQRYLERLKDSLFTRLSR